MKISYRTSYLVIIALMSIIGIALKPIVGPAVKSIAAAFFIPAGTIAGAVYMIWPLLALLLIRRFGTATAVGLLQGLIVMATGLYVSCGLLTLVIYTLPCLLIDIGFLPFAVWQRRILLIIPTALGNMTGTLLVGRLLMHLPLTPLFFSAAFAFGFGGAAGILAYGLYRRLSVLIPHFKQP